MCRVARIDRFLEEWPDAEYGPAHIVLSDCNLEDVHIDFCLAEFDKDDEHIYWPGELEATRAFLSELRALPEDQRTEPGDRLCKRWREPDDVLCDP